MARFGSVKLPAIVPIEALPFRRPEPPRSLMQLAAGVNGMKRRARTARELAKDPVLRAYLRGREDACREIRDYIEGDLISPEETAS